MSAKTNVSIIITSAMGSGQDGPEVSVASGDMYIRPRSIWYRYPEPNMEGTTTTVKVRMTSGSDGTVADRQVDKARTVPDSDGGSMSDRRAADESPMRQSAKERLVSDDSVGSNAKHQAVSERPLTGGGVGSIPMRQSASEPFSHVESITVVRHGFVRSEQTFVPNTVTSGTYRLAGGSLPLSMRTHDIDIRLVNGYGTIAWSYDLYTDGRYHGTYKLKLQIREDGT